MTPPTWLSGAAAEYGGDGDLTIHASANFAIVSLVDDAGGDNISVVTLGGTGMTKRYAYSTVSSLWYFGFTLGNPGTGAQALAVTGYGGGYYSLFHGSLSGVDNAAPYRASTHASLQGIGETSISASVTSTVDDLIVAFVRIYNPGTVTPQSGATVQVTLASDRNHYVVTKAGAAGSTSIGLDFTNAEGVGHSSMVAVAISGISSTDLTNKCRIIGALG